MEIETGRRVGTGIASGAALIVAGGVLALQQTGYLPFMALSRGWPLILIVMAMVRLAMTLQAPRWNGWALLLLADWLLANSMTDWVYVQFTLPILMAGIGVAMILRTISRRHADDRHEEFQANHYAT
jgi:hypothetical protein